LPLTVASLLPIPATCCPAPAAYCPVFHPAHGFTLQIRLDVALDEPIQNRIGQRRIVDDQSV
jgi:hypothetical protein